MAADLCMALELEKGNLCDKIITIVENDGSNANFIISALISHCIENKVAICLLASHNTFGHYHNVGVKLGGNLQKLRDEGFVKCIEVMKLMEASVLDKSSELNFLYNDNKEVPLKNLFLMLRKTIETLLETHNSVCILIDSISDLRYLGCNPAQVLNFFQYCRSLVYEMKGCSLAVLCHTSKEDNDAMKISAGMCYTSSLKVEVSGLNTGLSGAVSGMLNIEKNNISNVCSRKIYHFKLEDRRILVFPPGTSSAFV